MKRKKDSRVFALTSSLKRIGRSVGRKNTSSIARQAVLDDRICQKVLVYLGKKLSKEMKAMCSLKANSILRRRDVMSLQGFHLEALIKEMKGVAPNTLSLLRSCLASRKPSKAKNVSSKGPTKSRIVDCDSVVGVCCAILLRGRSQQMNLLQKIVSLILYSGHASKKVCLYRIPCILFAKRDHSRSDLKSLQTLIWCN